MTRSRKAVLVVVAGVLAAAGGATAYFQLNRASEATDAALAPARKGEFLAIVRSRGELSAGKSVQVVAPADVPDLRIMWLAPSGSYVNEGDVVIRFDASTAQRQLREKQTALEQAQAKLDEAVAQSRITAEEDKRNLAQADYDLERAELEVSKQEVVSAVQGEQARIDLGLAQKRLAVQEATQALHVASDDANIASLTRARDQARYEVELTEHRLSQMEVRAPGSGTIVYLQNYSQGYMNYAPFKVGDQVWANTIVAEIPDLSTLEIEGKVEESDRSRIDVGDEVRIQVDALPELTFHSSVRSISALTQMSFEYPPTWTFRAFAPVEDPDPRLRPAMPATMDVIVDRIADAITIPTRALFTLEGKPVVYVSDEGGYRAVEVEILARNPDEVAISGIEEGTMVSLREQAVGGDA